MQLFSPDQLALLYGACDQFFSTLNKAADPEDSFSQQKAKESQTQIAALALIAVCKIVDPANNPQTFTGELEQRIADIENYLKKQTQAKEKEPKKDEFGQPIAQRKRRYLGD